MKEKEYDVNATLPNNKENVEKKSNDFLVLKNENAYANGKKMTADEFFAMSEMILGCMDTGR